MTHCQQCRADAVGVVNDNSNCASIDDTSEKTSAFRIAIASNDNSGVIKTHFGHSKWFEIYEYSDLTKQFFFVENRSTEQYCQEQERCDKHQDEKDRIIQSITDCNWVLSSRIGIAPWRALETLGITPNVDFAFMSIHDILPKIAIMISNHSDQPSIQREQHVICNNE